MKTKATILCMTYNHVNYIAQALDSLVCQKTNFPFEIIIHDDASIDGTREIIEKYEKKYPNIIKAIYQNENQFSKGRDILTDFMIDYIQGEYVAINEGDDFWIDENKLQRQVDFLDSHHDFSICFHPVKVIWEDKPCFESIFPDKKYRFNKEILTIDDLLKHNFIQTNSVLYRWKLKKEMWAKKQVLPCDYLWHLIHAKYGKIGFLPQVMSVYRRNNAGIWTGGLETDNWFLKCGIPHIRFYEEIEKNFSVDKTKDKLLIAQNTIKALLKNKKFSLLKDMSEEFSEKWESFIDFSDYKMINKVKKLKKERFIYKIILILLLLLLIYLFLWW